MTQSTIVYLDQNMWIYLHQENQGQSQRDLSDVLDTIQTVSENKEVLFPLSLERLRETEKSHNRRNRRQQLRNFMTSISDLSTFAPWDIVRYEEKLEFIDSNATSKAASMSSVLGQGIPFMFAGNHWSIEFGEDDLDDEQNELKEELCEFAESIEAFEELAEDLELPTQTEEELEETIAEWEEIREEAHEAFYDNSQRRRYELAWYYKNHIIPDLTEYCLLSGKNPYQFHDQIDANFESFVNQDDEETRDFLKSFPSIYSYVNLTTSRDLNKSQDIHPNDLNDITALSVAIPYADIVVTEKQWKHIAANQTDIAESYNTVMSSDLSELPSLIKAQD